VTDLRVSLLVAVEVVLRTDNAGRLLDVIIDIPYGLLVDYLSSILEHSLPCIRTAICIAH